MQVQTHLITRWSHITFEFLSFASDESTTLVKWGYTWVVKFFVHFQAEKGLIADLNPRKSGTIGWIASKA